MFRRFFEVDKLGKFLAIVDLLGGHHALHWNNIRFVYNPLTKKLIPLGFDSDSGKKLSWLGGLSLQTGTFYNALKSPILAKEYLNTLDLFANSQYLEEFFNNNENYLRNSISKIHRTYPWTDSLQNYKKNIFFNKGYIKQSLNPLEPIAIFIDNINEKSINLSFKKQFLFSY